MKHKDLVKNISYSFCANIFSLLVSIFMVMVVPKFLSISDYGLWQLFLFYFSYLGFFHFGWEDGIYLRYAGTEFLSLDRKLFAGQFYSIILLQLIFAVGVILISLWCSIEDNKRVALICAILLLPLVNFNNLCNFIFQITNHIKDYAQRILLERGLFLLGVFFFNIILKKNQFMYMYYAELFSVFGVAIMGGVICRNLLIPRFYSLKEILRESYENISVGIKLMFANIASMLIVGCIRYGISIGWDVATFGRVSLTLGISNFLLVFINSVSVVFFPLIKKMNEAQRSSAYMKIRNLLTFLLFAALLSYYPVKCIFSWWLPKYADSLIYMSILFPVCVFESKVSLLINTYLKSMRQEALMLKINACSVLVSLIVTFLTVGVFHNLNLTVFSIVVVYAFRCVLGEYMTGRLLGLRLGQDILIDLGMCTIFIATSWIFNSWLCMVFYGLAYCAFLVAKRKALYQLSLLIM